MSRPARTLTLCNLRKVSTRISLSMSRRFTRIDTFRLLWIFSFRNHYSIPLFPWDGICRTGSVCADCAGWFWNDTLRRVHNVCFLTDGSYRKVSLLNGVKQNKGKVEIAYYESFFSFWHNVSKTCLLHMSMSFPPGVSKGIKLSSCGHCRRCLYKIHKLIWDWVKRTSSGGFTPSQVIMTVWLSTFDWWPQTTLLLLPSHWSR